MKMTMIQTTCDNPKAKYGLAETQILHVIILCGTASYGRRATNDERRVDGIALCFDKGSQCQRHAVPTTAVTTTIAATTTTTTTETSHVRKSKPVTSAPNPSATNETLKIGRQRMKK